MSDPNAGFPDADDHVSSGDLTRFIVVRVRPFCAESLRQRVDRSGSESRVARIRNRRRAGGSPDASQSEELQRLSVPRPHLGSTSRRQCATGRMATCRSPWAARSTCGANRLSCLHRSAAFAPHQSKKCPVASCERGDASREVSPLRLQDSGESRRIPPLTRPYLSYSCFTMVQVALCTKSGLRPPATVESNTWPSLMQVWPGR